MSKTTFFKRIALTSIAALGFGMLSVAPSQAVAGTPTLTVTTGSASVTQGGSNETSTAATVTITGLATLATDSYTVTLVRKTFPTDAIEVSAFRLAFLDTRTYTNTVVESATLQAVTGNGAYSKAAAAYESAVTNAVYLIDPGTTGGYVGARFGLLLDSETSRAGHEGDYVYTAVVTPFTNGTAGTPVTADLTFTINKTAAATALASGTIDPSKTTAVLNAGTGTTATTDASVSVESTADITTHATIVVKTYTSASLSAPESITATITGPGLVGDGTVFGKSLVLTGAGGSTSIQVRADGTAGVASIVIKTTTVTFPAKSVAFYAEEAASIVASVNAPVINTGANTDVIRAVAKDADGIVWGGTAYIYAASAANALIAGSATPVACSFQAAHGFHACPVSGTAKGTAEFKVIDASTVAKANATSNAVSTRVSTGAATTAVISFDKATYTPGERAQVRVSILDEAGLAMPAKTITAAFAADIATSKAFFSGSLSGSANITLDAATSATLITNAGHDTFDVYMPMSSGVVTLTATGSTGLALAGRVAYTASATVVDTAVNPAIEAANAASDAAAEAIDAANAATDAANLAAEAADAATVAAEEARDAADAATAAVEALATEVATLMAALKAQITTLANTVAKIAKKVKA